MEQVCKHLILKTESLENVYGCSDTRYGLKKSMEYNFELIGTNRFFRVLLQEPAARNRFSTIKIK
jgi:hypothetical protein